MIEGKPEPGEPFTSYEAAFRRAQEVMAEDTSIDQVMLLAAARPMGHVVLKPEGKTYKLEVAFTNPDDWYIITRDMPNGSPLSGS